MGKSADSVHAVIFDLDGVLVDTAQFHLAAWRRIAADYGFEFNDAVGESLKGVSREASLQLVLRAGGVALTPEEAGRAAARKNRYYRSHISSLSQDALLPGALAGLTWLHQHRIPVALGSASKNARAILSATGIEPMFDAIVDGNSVRQAKPDPAVFLLAVEMLAVPAGECVVFEDAIAGVQAAIAAGCSVVGVGDPTVLAEADSVVRSLADVSWHELISPGKQP